MPLSKRFNKFKKLEKITSTQKANRAILYLGHLPKGFNEEQLKGFFAQYGEVTRLRVSRSKKTARSRGYAYVEFADKEIAEIAANSMDKYLMFGKQVECHIVEDAHRDTFKNGNRDFKFIPTQLIFRKRKNEEKTPEQLKARVSGLLEKEKEKRDRLKELGIQYDFPGYKAIVSILKKSEKKIEKVEKKQEVVLKKEEKKPESVKKEEKKPEASSNKDEKKSKKHKRND